MEIACDPVGRFEYPDGGVSEQYQGIFSVEGVIYRFRCATFTDASGARYVESIGELEVVRVGREVGGVGEKLRRTVLIDEC